MWDFLNFYAANTLSQLQFPSSIYIYPEKETLSEEKFQ